MAYVEPSIMKIAEKFRSGCSLPDRKQPIETDLLKFLSPEKSRRISILQRYNDPLLSAHTGVLSHDDCYDKRSTSIC